MASGQSTPTVVYTYEGLALPLYGEGVMAQTSAGTKDILTLKYGSVTPTGTPTGNFLSFVNSAGTFISGVTGNGNLKARIYTTRPTTGLEKGEVMVIFHASLPALAVCTSTAAQTIRLRRIYSKTFGRKT